MDRFRSFDDVWLAYRDTGERDREPLVMLHGFTGSSEINWVRTGVYDKLRRSGRRIIMLDARGHGESDKPHSSYSYWNRAMAQDVHALMQHLGLFGFDILGFSMGAKVAIEAAVMYNGIRSLALAGLSIYDRDWEWTESERRARVRDMLAKNPKNPGPYRISADDSGGDRKAYAARLEGTIFPEFSHWQLKKIHIPVLVINGSEDYDAREAAGYFPNARGVALKGDHAGVLTHRNFAGRVLAFLDEQTASAA
mgnify:CR=1 FL=1